MTPRYVLSMCSCGRRLSVNGHDIHGPFSRSAADERLLLGRQRLSERSDRSSLRPAAATTVAVKPMPVVSSRRRTASPGLVAGS